MKQPRPYQDAALKSLWNWLMNETNLGNPLVVAPVGAGKSLLIAWFIKQVHEQYPRTRIVVLSHVKELLTQNADELRGVYPECDHGFYCAGLGQKRLHNDVTFASIQSVNGKLDAFNRVPEIIIVDECHLISHKGTTQYRKFFDAVLSVNPNCKIIGFTGTPFRSDTGRLEEGEGKLFDGIAYEIGMDYMIEEGYWAKPVTREIGYKIDASGVAVRGGDYVAGQLEKAINTEEINDACIKELVEKGASRNKWLVFTAGVEHCREVTNTLRNAGIAADMVTGDTPKEERAAIIESFRRGDIRCLVNVAVLTTGFNVPDIDLLCFMRPTKSPVLYIQCVGRGVRTVYADGYDLSTRDGRLDAIANSKKPDCLILDFGGVIDELGAIDQVSIKKQYREPREDSEGMGEAPPVKICPACAAGCASAQRYCYECGYQFFELQNKASERAVVSTDEEPEWWNVIGWFFGVHRKGGDPDATPSLRVTYATTEGSVNEFICYDHHIFEGTNKYYAYKKAVAWHQIHAKQDSVEIPRVHDCNESDFRMPSRVLVKRNGKWMNIIDREFSKDVNEGDRYDLDEDFEIPF